MSSMIEIHDNYKELGILTRKITVGKEYDLVKEFIDYRKNRFKEKPENQLAIFTEPKINNSYPDIVFVEFNPANFDNWESCRNELSSSDLKILHHLYSQRSLNATDIVTQLGVNWKDVMISIERLSDSKLIIRKNSSWQLKSRKTIELNRIEAVEAKINKVDEVFQQALINKTFASESYVLSKQKVAISEEKIERFNSFGIGVYMQKDSKFKTVMKSKKANIPVSFNSLYFNEWIGRILNQN